MSHEGLTHQHKKDCSCHHHEHRHHDHAHDHDLKPDHKDLSFAVNASFHDQALVISGRGSLMASREAVADALKRGMEAAADELNRMDAYIGHIKAYTENCAVDTFFLTDRTAECKKSNLEEATVHLTAILFGIEKEPAKKIFAQMFAHLQKEVLP